MAVHIGSGLSVQAQHLSPSTSVVVQGLDYVNFTLQFTYNTTLTAGNFSSVNSSGCVSLTRGSLVVKAFLTLPVVFHLVSNISHHSERITTNVSSCGGKEPKFIVTSNQEKLSNYLSTYDVHINITSSDVSWTVDIDFELLVSRYVLPDAQLNVSVDITDKTNINKRLLIAEYTAAKPSVPKLFVIKTSASQTPALNLTTSEELEFHISFKLPRVTSDVKLSVMLPLFRNSTPMEFLSGSVLSISNGVSGKNIQVGLPVTFRTSEDTSKLFGSVHDIAEINFLELSSTVKNLSSSVIMVKYNSIVRPEQGSFASQSEGSISFMLEYKTPKGKQILYGQVTKLRLDEPLLFHSFFIVNSTSYYEAKSLVRFGFIVQNPEPASRPAFNVSINIRFAPSDLILLNQLAQLCNVTSTTSCFNVSGPDSVSEIDGGLSVVIQR